MKKVIPGLVLGCISSIAVILTQVIFPNPEEANMWIILLIYLLIFFSFFASGFWYKITGGKGGGIRVGIITAVILFVMIMAAYFIVDNVFIGIVSKQTEKIWGFARSGYGSMRTYINMGLLKGFLLGLPMAAFLGAVFGGMGGVLAVFVSKKSDRKFPRILSLCRIFLPYAAVITLFTGMSYAVGQQVMRQGANDPQMLITNDMMLRLESGTPANAFIAEPVEISKSLSSFITVYDAAGKIVVTSSYLDGSPADLPQGIIPYVNAHGRDVFTWQPRRGVRLAVVAEKYQYKGQTGYVAVGRSLREVESRIDKLGYQLLTGWVISLGTVFFSLIIGELLYRAENRQKA